MTEFAPLELPDPNCSIVLLPEFDDAVDPQNSIVADEVPPIIFEGSCKYAVCGGVSMLAMDGAWRSCSSPPEMDALKTLPRRDPVHAAPLTALTESEASAANEYRCVRPVGINKQAVLPTVGA